MKNPLFGRPVNRRENPREAFGLGFFSENPDQVGRLALDGLINPLSLFIDAQLLDCRFNYWHNPNFIISASCLAKQDLALPDDFGFGVLTLFVRIHS